MGDLSRRTFLQIASVLAVGCGSDDETPPDVPNGDRTGPPATDGTPPGGSGDPPTGPAPVPPPTTVPGRDLDAITVSAQDFPYGVMAGDATPDRVVLWTRYTGTGALHVQIEAEGGPKGEAVISRPVADTERGDAGFVHVDA